MSQRQKLTQYLFRIMSQCLSHTKWPEKKLFTNMLVIHKHLTQILTMSQLKGWGGQYDRLCIQKFFCLPLFTEKVLENKQ